MHNFDQEMYHEHHKNSVFVALSHYIQFQIAYNTLLSGSTWVMISHCTKTKQTNSNEKSKTTKK